MAITFDAGSGNTNNGASSVTASHAVGAGSNKIIWGAAYSEGSGDIVTGMTYGGVAMTQAKKSNALGVAWLYLYYLVNPTTGTANLVVNASGSVTNFSVMGASFFGAIQTGNPDATSTQGGASSPIAGSVTTISDNAWAVMITRNGSGATTASTNSTEAHAESQASLFYSTAAKTPPGALTMNATYTGGAAWGAIMASFAPASQTIVLSQGSFTLTGQSIILSYILNIVLSVGNFVLTGLSINFTLKTPTAWTAQGKNSATWTAQDKN